MNKSLTRFSRLDREDAISSLSCSCSYALIMVMETAHFRNTSDRPHVRWLNRSGEWTVHLKRKMGAKSVVIADVIPE